MSYCTIEDLRNEGFTDEEQYPNEKLENLVNMSCAYIDRITGQFFEPRELSLQFDGRGGRNLVLPYPLIECAEVRFDDEIITNYVNYNRLYDRRYPKLYRERKWPKGFLNIKVSGTWGYVENDLSTPLPIKRAAMKLAMYYFPLLSDSDAQEDKNIKGLITSETTDGHSYSLESGAVNSVYMSSITGDKEIDDVLKFYTRSRLRMAVV